MYDSTLGRFMQRDPVAYVSGVNRYAYVDSMPTFSVDALGACATCTVTSITVEWQAGSTVVRRADYMDWYWEMVITGARLKLCEFTQFISSSTSLWDAKGTPLGKDNVLAAYKNSDITFTNASGPFASNVKDTGWGEGDNWRQFTSDDEEKIADRHKHPMPTYADGKERKTYAYEQKVDAVIKVREKATEKEITEHKWGYTVRNYSGNNPKAPIESKDAVGIYAHYGVKDAPRDMSKAEKK